MGAQNQANNPSTIVCHLGSISDAGDYPVAHLAKRFVLKEAYLMNGASVAADGTNYVTCTLKDASEDLGAIDTNSAGAADALTANEGAAMGAAKDLPAGSNLRLTYAEGGTGTLTDAKVVLYGHFL